MKGYIRKQATSKAVRKHMRNGGMNSFIFHPSPRMVPHIYRPEQKCLQLSIPEFVHRGKEVKDDAVLLLHFEKKLTEAEALTLARYFSNKDNTWKPSLIAYPHFQGFPSRVQMVKHSSRTIMLIDTMQRMQGQSCTWNSPSCDVEFQNYPDHSAEVRSFDKVDKTEEEYVEASNAELFLCTANTEMHSILNSPEKALGTTKPASDTSFGKDLYVEAAPVGEVLNAMALHDISGSKRLPVSDVTSPCHHLFLFSSQVASIDSIGRVLVAPIPILDVKEILHSLNPIARNSILPHCSGHAAAADSEAVYGDAKELLKETTFFASLSSPVETKCEHLEAMRRSQSPTPKINPVQKIRPGDFLHETANAMIYSSQQDFSNDDDEGEFDLSPRLVNFVKSGCVPESPIHGYTAGAIDDIEIIDMEPKVLVTSYAKDEGVVVISNPCTPVPKAAKSSINAEDYCEGVMEFRTPLANLTNSTCSKDWYMSSGEKPVGDKRNSNFKRLRKIGDTKSCNEMKENPGKFTNIECIVPVRRRPDNGGLERVLDVRDLIQEEAEVSSEVEVSTDEEDDQNDNTFEDSFINDKVDSTMATQLQSTEVDMMAIYRRSLLSQSPIRRQKKHSSPVTPDSLASVTSLNSCYETQNSLPTTPQTSTMHNSSSSRRISVCSRLEKIAEEAMPSTSGKIKNDKTSPQSSRKRKYSCGEHTVPAINLGNEFSSMHYPPKGPSLQGIGANPNDADWNFDMDDEFYESLDFDALEAQAAKLLEEKAAVSSSRKESVSEPIQPRVDNLGIPSFDLGIL
ncbi:hypothetical protein V2J09_024370 [Rumex salicifolius]